MNIKETLFKGTQILKTAKIASAPLDAELLLLEAINQKNKSYLYAYPEKKFSGKIVQKYFDLIKERAKHKPIAYILGKKEFYGLCLFIDKNVLIPRPETEILVEEALKEARKIKNPKIIDVGTGSGCIAASLAKNLPNAKIMATDLYADALKVAKKNVKKYNLQNQIKFSRSDLLKNVKGKFDIICANLPYISNSKMGKLAKDVKKEPKMALSGGRNGLDLYKSLLEQSKKVMKKKCMFFFEIDSGQSKKIENIIKTFYPKSIINIKKDYSGKNRVAIAKVNL